jgi:hypothetical protein
MKLKDKEAFMAAVKNNMTDDGYGSCGILFACLWAGAMEREIAIRGIDKLPEFADECVSEADGSMGSFGITGLQYGLAVSLLAQVWEHGEELRTWHNLKSQIGDEGERANETGGVLNPAIMHVADRK